MSIVWQECWDEVQRTSGVSLDMQQQMYTEAFTPWPAPTRRKIKIEVMGEDPDSFTAGLVEERSVIASATSVLELQKTLIILNANEFKLRDNPTSEEFEEVLVDHKRWYLRTEACWIGSDEAKNEVHVQLDALTQEARAKFTELTRGVSTD